MDIQEGRATLVDVRTIDEYNDGHAAYAINIPLDETNNINLDKNKRLYVYCASGRRSELAENILYDKGYSVVNIGSYFDAIDSIGEA